MTIDTGRFLRLKGMVDGVLASSSSDQRSLQAKALSDAYLSLRDEARELAEAEAVTAEFDRLFPNLPGAVPSSKISSAGFDPFEGASYANEAAAALAKLSGWLNGFVEQARLAMEAEAYAKARVNQERGTR
jgi:hypothetical protein